MRKQELKGILVKHRFKPIDKKIFLLLDEFKRLCDKDGTEEELALAHFLKGEACFRMGIYEDTVDNLNKSLSYQTNTPNGVKLAISAYNMLGLIFSFMGYEIPALENYFYSIDISEKHQIYASTAVTYINMGWLYRDLGNYEKAMECYNRAFEAVRKASSNGYDYNVEALCYAYKGQLHYKIGEYEEAVECLKAIEKMEGSSLYYEVSIENLCTQVYHYLGNMEKVKENLASIIRKASSKDDFVEFFEFYADACVFAMEKGMKEEARQLLDAMEKSAGMLELAYVQLRLRRIEVFYRKKYSTHEDYLNACQMYVTMQEEYQKFINQNKLVGMRNIEYLRNVKKEKDTYKEISRRDNMTGLLNKNTLENAICEYLNSEGRSEGGALLVVDLDHFKQVNDTGGHLKGDMVIKDMAQKLKDAFVQYKLLGRIGGDEFAVFIREPFDRENVIERAAEFCEKVKRMDYSKEEFTVSVSVGIAFLETEIHTYEQLFSIADKALYTAKDCGRGRVYVGN